MIDSDEFFPDESEESIQTLPNHLPEVEAHSFPSPDTHQESEGNHNPITEGNEESLSFPKELEEIFQTFLDLGAEVDAKNLPESSEIRQQIEKTLDLITKDNHSEEELALFILLGIESCQKAIDKAHPIRAKIRNLVQFGARSEEAKKLEKAKKILKTQGNPGIDELARKLRWEAGKCRTPLEYARLTLLEQKILNLKKPTSK